VVTEKTFVQATIDPSATGRFQPDYPLSLIRAEIEGTATVRILIGTDGQVKQVVLVSATNPAFFDATRKQALRYWRFRPATTDGSPTESWRVMTVKFHLES
jgi:protein TonB